MFLIACVAACTASAAGAGPLTMSATAGLAGAARPGRWMPVRVDVDNGDQDVAGQLIVQWGSATVERAVSILAPSRHTYELFIRTGDVRDTVTVRLRSMGRDLKALDVPVRVIGNDESFSVCVDGDAAVARDCSVAIPSSSLPRSWRGYDTSDQVLIPEAVTLGPDQRKALRLWRAIRATEAAGLSINAGTVPEDAAPWRHTYAVLGAYLACLAFVALMLRLSRHRSRLAVAAMAAVVCGASVAAFASGRMTPVVIRHTTVVQQYAGVSDSLITMRGGAELPSDGTYAIRPLMADGAINVGPAYGRPMPLRFDGDGYPLLAGDFGLGSTQPFQLEVAAAVRVLDVSRQGERTRVTNVSERELRDCEMPAAFAARPGMTLAPGQSIETSRSLTDADLVMTCSFDGSPVDFVDPVHQVITAGATTVVYHFAGGVQ